MQKKKKHTHTQNALPQVVAIQNLLQEVQLVERFDFFLLSKNKDGREEESGLLVCELGRGLFLTEAPACVYMAVLCRC